MKKKYIVELTDSDRAFLKGCVDKGKNTAYEIKHAHILLKADAAGPAWTDTRIAEAFGCHAQTVYNVRRSFVERGLSGALSRATPRKPSRAPKLDGAAEARLIALSCGEPPVGFAKWTLRLLAEALVALECVESVCHETVRRTLKKTRYAHICGSSG